MNKGLIATVSAVALGASFAFATPAQANLTFTDGYAGTAPGGSAANDLFLGLYGTTSRLGYFYGDVADVDGVDVGYVPGAINLHAAVDVNFEYLGKEAGFTNLFQVFYDADGAGGAPAGWNTIFSTATNAAGDDITISGLGVGVLQFRYVIDNVNHGLSKLAVNGGAAGDFCTDCSIFTTAVGGTGPQATSNSVYDVFLDDSGAGNNDNHDDLAVRITAVPVPAALPIIAAALAGFGFAGYRSRRPNA